MKDKNKLKEILEKYDIDELWINFEHPFEGDHDKDGEKVYLYKKGVYLNDRDLSSAIHWVMCFFAPKFNSDEEEDILSVDLWYEAVAEKDIESVEEFNRKKDNLTLLYRKGVGFCTD